MAFTYNDDAAATPAGRVRLLIFDTDSSRAIFSDAEIAAFLSMEGSVVERGAARALETIARQQALLLKVMRRLDLETDGAKLAAELRASAKLLRDQADEAEASEGDLFDVAEFVDNHFSARERIWKQMLRNQV